jgi:NAD-dependent deacetylase
VTLKPDAHLLADAIAAEKGLVLVLTGAGVSLASGLPTFRGNDTGAVWAQNVMELGTFSYFKRNPVASWQWYLQRANAATYARPNPAHLALATLQQYQLARGGDFLLVTQNIDSLHEMAGSLDVVKIHGSLNRARCSRARCELNSTETVAMADLDFEPFERDPTADAIPRCSACGGLMRPHVLWFDELYGSHKEFQWTRVIDASARMRLIVAIGTSFSVGITDALSNAARSRRIPMTVIDPAPPRIADPRTTHMSERAEELLPLVADILADDR